MPKPKIGFLPTGHKYYWKQFPCLKSRGIEMFQKYLLKFRSFGEVIIPRDVPVDTPGKSSEAGKNFVDSDIDILFIMPFGYTTGMVIVPAVNAFEKSIPIRILNSHEDSSYAYEKADTEEYLHHEGVCCVPEYAGTLRRLNKHFIVRSGPLESEALWKELQADIEGAAAAKWFKKCNFAIIGNTYTNMTDMPIDEHRVLKATGRMIVRPEIEELENAYEKVTQEHLTDMYDELRESYAVDASVKNSHLEDSAKLCVVYEKIVNKYNINAFGYYWWGEKESVTLLRSESAIAVTRLASKGCPGVTEGDLKTAMSLKIMDLLGAGGMFLEFFSMDFDENFLLMGHDGPSNINMASGKPELQHLQLHHGKSGHGLGIDFKVKEGPVTLLNLTQFYEGDCFKLIYSIGEVIPGPILCIGNPNCRVRVAKPIPQFINDWSQQGPCHHFAMGYGDRSAQLETFAEVMGFDVVKV